MEVLLRTVPEAVGRLRVSRVKVYDLISRGELTSVRVGRRRFITADSIDDFIERHTEPRPGGEAA